jgi:hypothetical protein
MKLHACSPTFKADAGKSDRWRASVVDETGEIYCVAVAASPASATERAKQIIENRSKVGELINRTARMLAAIQPFLTYASTLGSALPDDAPITNGLRSNGKITAGECRALVRSAQQ